MADNYPVPFPVSNFPMVAHEDYSKAGTETRYPSF